MKFTDPELKKHYERVIPLMTSLSENLRAVCALMDACGLFRRHGELSPSYREAIEHLLSPELRPALRDWYRQSGENMNPAAIQFRDRLSEMAGERFG